MKISLKLLAISIALSIGFIGCGDDTPKTSPVKIEVTTAYNKAWNYYYPKVSVISVSDKVTVTNVLINKGNCTYRNEDLGYANGKFKAIKLVPRTLKYGEKLNIDLKKCEVMKVEVVTDQGNWTVEY